MTQHLPLAFRIVLPQGPQGEEEVVRRPSSGGEAGALQPDPVDPGGPQGPAPGQPTTQDACLQQLPFILAMVAIFYFLLIRPQQKTEKRRRSMLSALKAGDSVVTSGGLHGTVAKLAEDTVVLNVANTLQLTFDRANIARVMRDEAPDAS